ncbi:hypothetical protein CYMTET_14842, partial [Cymbomonas tetramitiformis]
MGNGCSRGDFPVHTLFQDAPAPTDQEDEALTLLTTDLTTYGNASKLTAAVKTSLSRGSLQEITQALQQVESKVRKPQDVASLPAMEAMLFSGGVFVQRASRGDFTRRKLLQTEEPEWDSFTSDAQLLHHVIMKGTPEHMECAVTRVREAQTNSIPKTAVAALMWCCSTFAARIRTGEFRGAEDDEEEVLVESVLKATKRKNPETGEQIETETEWLATLSVVWDMMHHPPSIGKPFLERKNWVLNELCAVTEAMQTILEKGLMLKKAIPLMANLDELIQTYDMLSVAVREAQELPGMPFEVVKWGSSIVRSRALEADLVAAVDDKDIPAARSSLQSFHLDGNDLEVSDAFVLDAENMLQLLEDERQAMLQRLRSVVQRRQAGGADAPVETREKWRRELKGAIEAAQGMPSCGPPCWTERGVPGLMPLLHAAEANVLMLEACRATWHIRHDHTIPSPISSRMRPPSMASTHVSTRPASIVPPFAGVDSTGSRSASKMSRSKTPASRPMTSSSVSHSDRVGSALDAAAGEALMGVQEGGDGYADGASDEDGDVDEMTMSERKIQAAELLESKRTEAAQVPGVDLELQSYLRQESNKLLVDAEVLRALEAEDLEKMAAMEKEEASPALLDEIRARREKDARQREEERVRRVMCRDELKAAVEKWDSSAGRAYATYTDWLHALLHALEEAEAAGLGQGHRHLVDALLEGVDQLFNAAHAQVDLIEVYLQVAPDAGPAGVGAPSAQRRTSARTLSHAVQQVADVPLVQQQLLDTSEELVERLQQEAGLLDMLEREDLPAKGVRRVVDAAVASPASTHPELIAAGRLRLKRAEVEEDLVVATETWDRGQLERLVRLVQTEGVPARARFLMPATSMLNNIHLLADCAQFTEDENVDALAQVLHKARIQGLLVEHVDNAVLRRKFETYILQLQRMQAIDRMHQHMTPLDVPMLQASLAVAKAAEVPEDTMHPARDVLDGVSRHVVQGSFNATCSGGPYNAHDVWTTNPQFRIKFDPTCPSQVKLVILMKELAEEPELRTPSPLKLRPDDPATSPKGVPGTPGSGSESASVSMPASPMSAAPSTPGAMDTPTSGARRSRSSSRLIPTAIAEETFIAAGDLRKTSARAAGKKTLHNVIEKSLSEASLQGLATAEESAAFEDEEDEEDEEVPGPLGLYGIHAVRNTDGSTAADVHPECQVLGATPYTSRMSFLRLDAVATDRPVYLVPSTAVQGVFGRFEITVIVETLDANVRLKQVNKIGDQVLEAIETDNLVDLDRLLNKITVNRLSRVHGKKALTYRQKRRAEFMLEEAAHNAKLFLQSIYSKEAGVSSRADNHELLQALRYSADKDVVHAIHSHALAAKAKVDAVMAMDMAQEVSYKFLQETLQNAVLMGLEEKARHSYDLQMRRMRACEGLEDALAAGEAGYAALQGAFEDATSSEAHLSKGGAVVEEAKKVLDLLGNARRTVEVELESWAGGQRGVSRSWLDQPQLQLVIASTETSRVSLALSDVVDDISGESLFPRGVPYALHVVTPKTGGDGSFPEQATYTMQ